MNQKNRKNEDAGILSWIINVILLSVVPPVGIFLLVARFFWKDILGSLISSILNSTGNSGSADSYRSSTHRTEQHDEPNSSSRSRAAQNGQTATGAGQVDWNRVRASQNGGAAPRQSAQNPANPRPAPNAAAQTAGSARPNAAAKKEKSDDGIAHISTGKKALFIFGWILIAAGVIGGIGAWGTTLWRVLKFIAVILGGGAMLFTAHTKDKKERLYQNCVKIVGNKSVIDLKSLARVAGVKPKKLERELDEMLERGYFPPAAYYDNEHDVLVLDPEKAQANAPSARQTEPKEAHSQDKFDLLMQELDRACGRIQDRDMLEKSVQIRGLTAAIFHAVRENPERESQISNFVNYYFPTTLKLLDSYADFEAKGYQGEKLTQTKDRIESTADTIIAAYQKQLDNLYLTDTLDVDTDIDVLETMLKRDGLSESDFGQSGTPGL